VDNVLCLLWQDSNLILALSTIHSATDVIDHLRKRPEKRSTNAGIVLKVFGDSPKKKLAIPVFIDDYSHHMNGVDVANQKRSSYSTHKTTHCNWFPILYWLLDAAIVNAYHIQCVYYKQQQKPNPIASQLDFREKLYMKFFAFAAFAKQDGLPISRLDSTLNHKRIQLKKRRVCMWCQYKRRLNQENQSKQTNHSTSGCSACGEVPLCLKTTCWVDFHSKAAKC